MNANDVFDLAVRYGQLRTAETEAFLVETLARYLRPEVFGSIRDAINKGEFALAKEIIDAHRVVRALKENEPRWIGVKINGELVAEKMLEPMPWEAKVT